MTCRKPSGYKLNELLDKEMLQADVEEYRQRYGLTHVEMADVIGCQRHTYYEFRSNRKDLSSGMAIAIILKLYFDIHKYSKVGAHI